MDEYEIIFLKFIKLNIIIGGMIADKIIIGKINLNGYDINESI